MKNKKIIGIFIMTLLTITAINLLTTKVIAEDPPGEPPFEVWFIEGYGTYFEITNSSYLNITLTSSENISILLESYPRTVSYLIEGNCTANSTEITLSGFEACKTYYMYEYGNLSCSFITNENGSYTYIQDLSTAHNVFILEETYELSESDVYIDAYGNYFEITDSKYLNVTLTSSEHVHVILSSKQYSIDYYIESNCSATSTEITLTGFEVCKTYYFKENGYLTSNFTTNENGSYSYIQDLTTNHHIVISEYESTIVIFPDGSIYPSTAPLIRNGYTYTLTDNIYDTIWIQKLVITLDGQGYTIHESSSSGAYGVDGWDLTDVTIKNLKIEGFVYGINLEKTSKITINNCSIKSCPGLWDDRAGIHGNWNYDVTITNCTITNRSMNWGLGIDIVFPIGFHPWEPFHCAKIKNCTISNCSGGINVGALDDVLVRDNTIIDTSNRDYYYNWGMNIDDCIYGNITNNSIKSKEIYKGVGIRLNNDYRDIAPSHTTVNINVENNTIQDFQTGIEVYQQDDVNIIDNTIYRNWLGIRVWWNSRYNHIAENNLIYGGDGIDLYWYAQYNTISQNNISNFKKGIFIHDWVCVYNNISQNIISNSYEYGIYSYISGPQGNTYYQNDISNNVNGIFLVQTDNNKLEDNLISDNSGFGIRLYRAKFNNIFNNIIENNGGTGIWLSGYRPMDWYSTNNLIYYNCIINNAVQAYDDVPYWNKWHHPGLLEGNYWSDYLGYDDGSGTAKHAIAGDGIGDTDIPHPTTHYDFYPFDLCGRWRNTAPFANADGPYNNAVEGSPLIFDASNSSDPDGDILQYRWDFNNDGVWDTNYSTDPFASYTWDDDYTGNVTVEVFDGDLTDTSTTTVTVNNVAPTADAGVDHVGDEPSTFMFTGSHTDPGILDTHTYEWDFNYDGVTFDVDATGNEIQHVWEDDFDGTVALRVTDDDGGWHIDTCNITVNNVAPAISSLSLPIDPLALGTPVDLTASFIDPGVLDTHNVTVDWGDGNNTNGSITGSGGTYNVSSSWTYSQAGVYTITLSVEDDDGGNDTQQFRYVVVYDPSAGFVTGGGWINSPEGAYKPDTNLTGKANFGFVSKYKQGQTTPSGNTQFNFKVADLNFHSNDYDWLVVAGAKAMYKGTGTINNEGSYKFILSAIDEDKTPSKDIDMFRIRIWEEDDQGNEIVIYDNNIGDDDFDSDPETEISGGNIVIHNN